MERDRRIIVPPQQYITNEELIKEVRKRPALWDDSLPEHKDRALKKVLWNAVAAKFTGGSPNAVQKTWDGFRRALNNCRNTYLKKHGASGSEAHPYKPYIYEAEMSFLDGLAGGAVDQMEGNLDDEIRLDDIGLQDSEEEEEDDEEKVDDVVGLKLSFKSDENCDSLVSSTPGLSKSLGIKKGVLNTVQINHQFSPPKPITYKEFKVTFGDNKNGSLLVSNETKENVGPSKVKRSAAGIKAIKSPVKKKRNVIENSQCLEDQSKIVAPTMTPAARKDLKRRQRTEELDKRRAEAMKKLSQEVDRAEQLRNQKMNKPPHTENEKQFDKGCCSSRLEELLVAELSQESNPRKMFLMSLSDSVLELGNVEYRKFQHQVLNILSELGSAKVETAKVESGRFCLPQHKMVEVEKILGTKADDRVIIIGDIMLYGRDLHVLIGCEWLNDQIMNAYFCLIQKRSHILVDAPSVVCTSTFFLPALLKKGCDHVKDWSELADLPSADMLFVPVHQVGHWSLIVADLQAHTITYCDSYSGSHPSAMQAVQQLLRLKTGNIVWIPLNSEDMPEQKNGYDCGVFVCMYANYTVSKKDIT